MAYELSEQKKNENLLPDEFSSPLPLIDLNQFSGEEAYSPTITIPQPEGISLSNKKEKKLTFDLKTAVVQMLLQHSTNGKLPRGGISKIANHFFISTRSVHRIWHTTKTSIANGSIPDVSSKLVKKVGRKRVQIDSDLMKSIPFRRRTSMRSTTSALGVSKATVQRRIKEGILGPHSNAIKPYLTDDYKNARLEFCLSMIDKEVGIGLVGFSFFFTLLGAVLFFDRGLLALGNIFFLSGVALLLGWQSMWQLFSKKTNYKGSIPFFAGMFLIFVRWPIVGIIFEIYGSVVLFSGFWSSVRLFLRQIPVVGWFL